MALSISKRKLTPGAALTGGIIALSVYLGMGFKGVAMLGAFFILGTGATAWQKNKKYASVNREAAERKTSQVIANGGVAALCGLLCFVFPEQKLVYSLMLAGSLSTATADTLSSELGTLYGTRFINIITLQSDIRGLDGVISFEGIIIGLLGSAFIALIYSAGNFTLNNFILIVIAGTAGNLFDSLLGALLERKNLLSNDAVNFIATLIGAALAGVCVVF